MDQPTPQKYYVRFKDGNQVIVPEAVAKMDKNSTIVDGRYYFIDWDSVLFIVPES